MGVGVPGRRWKEIGPCSGRLGKVGAVTFGDECVRVSQGHLWELVHWCPEGGHLVPELTAEEAGGQEWGINGQLGKRGAD